MHFYQFNIKDYQSHTGHLDEFEDLAYRRLLDWCYLHERHLPAEIEEIARLIRMRTHSECIASVLREFFVRTDEGWISPRVMREIDAVNTKSEKARLSAKARWDKQDANALRTQSEGNAPITHDPLPITQKVKTQRGTRLPTDLELPDEWKAFCAKERPDLNPDQLFATFRDYWVAQPGQKGLSVDWFAFWRNWVRNQRLLKPVDVAKTTVPGTKERDPALRKMEQDRAQAAPMPPEVKEKLAVFLKR